jgi:dihydroorotase
MSTIAIFGSYVLSRKDGAQEVLRDHWVLLEGRRIAAVTRDRPSATEVFDRPGRFVLPGLLNLHNHCFSEAVARTHTEDGNGRRNNQSIVYTVLLPLTKRGADLLSPSERLAIARLGILQLLKGGATTVMEMNPIDAVTVAEANRDLIVGIKVRVGLHASGTSGILPLDIALEVAEEVGMPLMAHIDHPPPSYEEVLARLRPGDVLTHAFRPFPNTPATAQGTVKRVVLEARERGVLFDIGHGKGSFAFKTARAMLANGFYPDTISSDVHALCIDGPAFDQVTTMSKFLCMGMPLSDVVAASTVNAAMALRRPELGSLKPGSAGDATLISIPQGQFDYVDVVGERLIGDRMIVSEGVVIGGRWWHPKESSKFRRLADQGAP